MKKLTDGRWMPSDGNTSHDPYPGWIPLPVSLFLTLNRFLFLGVHCDRFLSYSFISSPDPKGHVRYCQSETRIALGGHICWRNGTK
jgi:hypothetical protein